MPIDKLIYYTSILSPALVLIAGRKQKTVLWYYAMVCLLADLVSFYLFKMQRPHAIVSNSFLLLEFLFFGYYFLQPLVHRRFRVFTIITALIISIAYIVYTYNLHQIAIKDSLTINYTFATYFYFCYIIFCLLSLFNILQKAEETHLGSSPEFYATIGILIYASAVFMLFAFRKVLEHEYADLLRKYWGAVFQPANILKNVFLAISVYYADRRNK